MQIVERKNRSIVIDGIVDNEVRSRNFGGEERRDRNNPNRVVNGAGKRNFLLYISDEIAEELSARGCEVKFTTPREPNDVPRPYVSITVSYFLKPVEAYMISNGNPTVLDENSIYHFNSADIQNMCLELEFGKEKQHLNGTTYTPIYAQKLWVEVVPSYIASKFGHFMQPAAGTPNVQPNDDGIPFA